MSYDLIGVGFGPASVAVAVALIEKWEAAKASGQRPPINRIAFIEKHDRFSWHPGMLLPGAKMQVSFLKDMATLRNPASPFTFLSYLHEHNRLVPFINRGIGGPPTRREYADYLTWVARKVEGHEAVDVLYGEEVTSVDSDETGELVTVASRSNSTGEEVARTSKNLILSPGGQANIPSQFQSIYPHPQIAHTSAYAFAVDKLLHAVTAPSASLQKPLRVAVIGAGQSSAEVYLDLASRLTSIPVVGGRHQLDLIFRRGSLKPADDSPFANETFNPEATDFMFNLSEHARERVVREYHGTNYSVMSPETLQTIYETIYEQKLEMDLAGRDRSLETEDDASKPLLKLLPYSTITNVSTSSNRSGPNDRFTLELQHALYGKVEERTYDAIILGTGYDRTGAARLLINSKTIRSAFGLAPSTPSTAKPSTLNLSRNYRLLPRGVTTSEAATFKFKPAIYVQGSSELSHGLSDTLLSVASVRAGEITDDLLTATSKKEVAGPVVIAKPKIHWQESSQLMSLKPNNILPIVPWNGPRGAALISMLAIGCFSLVYHPCMLPHFFLCCLFASRL